MHTRSAGVSEACGAAFGAAADLVLADSDHKPGCYRVAGCAGRRIRVIYCGVGPDLRPISCEGTLASLRQRYKLERPFILGLGTLDAEELCGVITAFARLLEEYDLHTIWLSLAARAGSTSRSLSACVSWALRAACAFRDIADADLRRILGGFVPGPPLVL